MRLLIFLGLMLAGCSLEHKALIVAKDACKNGRKKQYFVIDLSTNIAYCTDDLGSIK